MESENESAEATTPSAAAGQAQSILGHSVTRRQVLSGLAAGALVPALGRDLIRSAGTTRRASASKVNLRISHWWSKAMAEDLGPMSTLMPQVTTTLENTPYPQYEQKIITQLAAGTAPDIILIDAYWAGDFFALDKFVPLNNYLKSLNYDTNSWYKNSNLRPQGRGHIRRPGPGYNAHRGCAARSFYKQQAG